MVYQVMFRMNANEYANNEILSQMKLYSHSCGDCTVVSTDDIFVYSKLLLMDGSSEVDKEFNNDIICPLYRIRSDVDNQLGYLYDKIKKVDRFDYERIMFEPNVYIAKNVFDMTFAKEVRDFLNKIPIDFNTPLLDDVTNKPRDYLYNSCNYNVEGTYNPSEWTWEHYAKNQIWRCLPLTIESFIGSPIFTLIEKLEQKFNLEFFSYAAKSTWVLQRLCKGNSIGEHSDDSGIGEKYPRKFAFIYYLTPDGWDYNVDGGELCIRSGTGFTRLNPVFNSIVVWDMSKQKSPIHKVNEVLAENDRPRYALVGFLV